MSSAARPPYVAAEALAGLTQVEVMIVTVLLIRHADIEIPPPIGDPDPALSAKGLLRAEALVHAIGQVAIASIFTSSLKRTRQTASPLAAKLALGTELLPDDDSFADDLRSGHYGTAVLIVGHSNTVPQLIEGMTGVSATSISIGEKNFDNLYLVTLTETESQLQRMKYGTPTP